MKRYIIIVTGKVQGVFFRDTARQVATRLGLAGFARNESDGSVRIEVEGDDIALKTFLDWCHHGPANAVVEHVSHEKHPSSGHSGFEIA